jgi:hypothetical protein
VNIPDIHVLHTHDDVARVVLESAVESDDKVRVAVVHDPQLSYYSLSHLAFCLDVDDLVPVSVDPSSIGQSRAFVYLPSLPL